MLAAAERQHNLCNLQSAALANFSPNQHELANQISSQLAANQIAHLQHMSLMQGNQSFVIACRQFAALFGSAGFHNSHMFYRNHTSQSTSGDSATAIETNTEKNTNI